jgi:DNA-directed RNA polymerase subunit K/omega
VNGGASAVGIPLDILIDNTENVYQLTCIAIKRAEKIVRPVIELEEGVVVPEFEETEKITSQALSEALAHQIEYHLEEGE